MHAKLLKYYNQELMHIRESAEEFARNHEKVAKRLSLHEAASGGECPDPYVERLLEGFAFLTARVQIRQDAEYSRFTQHLLELVFPGLLAPTPSILIAQIQPDLGDPGLAEGPSVPRASLMDSRLQPGDRTPCTFRTAHDVRLWPLEIVSARFQSHVTDLDAASLAIAPSAGACIRLRLKVTAALKARQLKLDRLTLHLCGPDEVAFRVYEQLFARCQGIVVHRPRRKAESFVGALKSDCLEPGGLSDEEALLPAGQGTLSGYRLLKEYAALPARFLFAHLNGLQRLLQAIDDDEFELIFLLDRPDSMLEKSLDTAHFMLHAVPAVNLFPKRIDQVEIRPGQFETALVPDAVQRLNYEIYSIQAVRRIDESGQQQSQPVYSLYQRQDSGTAGQASEYFSIQRVARFITEEQRQRARSGYVGTDLLLSIVDREEQYLKDDHPWSRQAVRLAVDTLCSNRDLPVFLSQKQEFLFRDGFPVHVCCVRAPSRPVAMETEGRTPWLLLSHLHLNYLSFVDQDAQSGASSLRELLSIYGANELCALHNQLKGLVSVTSKPVIARVPVAGPIAFGRGVQVKLTLDEQVFEGSNILVLATVLERLLARHATLNSFVQLVLHSPSRDEVKKWKPRIGQRLVG